MNLLVKSLGFSLLTGGAGALLAVMVCPGKLEPAAVPLAAVLATLLSLILCPPLVT